MKSLVDNKNTYFKSVWNIAVPITLQCMLGSSFSVVDQIMIGNLGSISITSVGLAGKFHSMFGVMANAIAAVAGIMIAQYLGMKSKEDVNKSVSVNLVFVFITAAIFSFISIVFSGQIMSLYTNDNEVIIKSAEYLRIISFSYCFRALCVIGAVVLRNLEKTKFPLYAGMLGAVINTSLNYILIYGKLGFKPLGAKGAGIATVTAQAVECVVVVIFALNQYEKNIGKFSFSMRLGNGGYKQYFKILLPIFLNEFLWSLGENVYSSIYGHLGTLQCAAMTLISPIITLTIGGLSGLSAAAGILIGKRLGAKEYEDAYNESKKLIFYGIVGSVAISLIIFTVKGLYVNLFNVETETKEIAKRLITAFILVSPVKTLNMITGGGIIRSGGKTQIALIIDLIGTWGIGVPLGLLSAYVFNLSIPLVYFILSQEELVRLIISLVIFKKKTWMNSLLKI